MINPDENNNMEQCFFFFVAFENCELNTQNIWYKDYVSKIC